MVVSRIKYYKNISTPRYSTWFPYSRSTAFPTQIFRDLLINTWSSSKAMPLRTLSYLGLLSPVDCKMFLGIA
jgi:hypothetical protein